ncbi:type II toxin-antitoxin system prevent-host-death family antitoxin [Myxococcota bacterium]|nr:type II toxin-antitoxin system prevent-host-death family antitoxin [Myxococcota bacterium]
MKATTTDLRFHSKELIDTVARGEEVVITFRGKPCAKLVPYDEPDSQEEDNELFGMWADNPDTENVADFVKDLRKRRF